MTESILYLSDPSPSKIDALNNTIIPTLSTQHNSYTIKSLVSSYECDLMPEQPMNQGIEILCFMQLIDAAFQYHRTTDTKNNDDIIIAVKHGIYETNNGSYDVSVMMIYKPRDASIKRYNSYGTKINVEHYNNYLEHVMEHGSIYQLNQSLQSIHNNIRSKTNHRIKDNGSIDGSSTNNDQYDILANIDDLPDTFQSYIDTYIKSAQKKLEQDIVIGYSHRFKEFNSNRQSIDQKSDQDEQNIVQFLDCVKKYIIDVSAETKYNEQLKIVNKQTVYIVANPILSNILYELLERYIRCNFQSNKIDYFVGTNNKAFYLAPVVAKIFKKGYIPVQSNEQNFDIEFLIKKCSVRTVINVLILNEQLTTGSGIIDLITSLNTIPNINILGIVSIFDSPELRAATTLRLKDIKIVSKILIDVDNNPTDFEY